MKTKTIESLSSKKFDSKDQKEVFGGMMPMYGNWYCTTNGIRDVNGSADEARTTYNQDGNGPITNQGQDHLTYFS